MLPFFLLLLLGLPWVGTTVNNATGLDNSTTGLSIDIEPRQSGERLTCKHCSEMNTFNCPRSKECQEWEKYCAVLAVRMNSRELLTYKNCLQDCSFVYKVHLPSPVYRKLTETNSYYYVHCCVTHNCNDIGPSNIERDLLPDLVVEETTIERAVCLGEFNLLLSLASILSSRILA